MKARKERQKYEAAFRRTLNPADLVDLPTAAMELRMSYQQVWKRVLTGELVGRKVGCHWFVERGSLTAYAANG